MAERRRFAKSIVLSDAFLDMPLGARCLYMTMGMMADDDGFVNNARTIIRITGATEDDLRVLIAKKFILPFEDGVIVIKHWRINNYLRNDRYQETKYIEDKANLLIDKNGAYTLNDDGIPNLDSGIPSSGIPSIGKDSIGKDSINNIYMSSDEDTPKKKVAKFIPPTVDEISEYCRERKNNVNPEKFFDFYESKGWMVGKNKMKDWKAAVRTWERGDNKSSSQKSTPVSNIMEYEIDNGDTHPQIPPYYGFPAEWFEGNEPVRDRFKPLKQIRNFNIGVTDDTIYSPDELWDKYILRKRGYEYEQQLGFNDRP